MCACQFDACTRQIFKKIIMPNKRANIGGLILKNRIKEVREAKGLSRPEFNKLFNYPRFAQILRLYETHQIIPSAMYAFKIAEVLETPLSELFYLDFEKCK